MAKKELKEQLKSYEGYINDIPLVIDPCKQCKVYKKNKGYDMGHYDKEKDEYIEGVCKNCCWFYPSNFELNIEAENLCSNCKHKNKITSGKEPCHSCDNGNRWEE